MDQKPNKRVPGRIRHAVSSATACNAYRWASIIFVLIVATSTPVAAQDTITYLSSWGSAGTGNGQFSGPDGIAVGSNGNVYVTDLFNNRVEYFDRSGGFLGSFGAMGTGDGQFTNPSGIGIDSLGNVYIADRGNNRIEEFTSAGSFIFKTGTFGSANGQFSSPGDVRVGPTGNIYVLDGGNGRVQELTSAGAFVTGWGSTGTAQGEFSSPQELAVGGNGNVYVSDNGNSRIQAFDGSGVFQTTWSTGTSPVGIAVNSSGQVYVGDVSANMVAKDSATGTSLVSFGGPGSGVGQFNGPFGVAVAPTGEVYVADSGNNRVERWFDPNAWVSGSNTFASAGVGVGQLLGTSQALAAGKTLNVTGTTTINAGGTLSVTGGSLTTGALSLSAAAATFQIDNGTAHVSSFSAVSGASYQIGIGGAAIGSQYGSLSVSGSAALGGTFTVNLLNGFHPTLGEQFVAISFGSSTGDFASYAGLAVGGHLTLHHAIIDNSLVLTARPTVNGDVNTDGVVNGLDINIVASRWLQSGVQGDANGDGVVNGLDINLIASNWLKTDSSGGAGSGAAVLEPSSLVLAAVGGLTMLASLIARTAQRGFAAGRPSSVRASI